MAAPSTSIRDSLRKIASKSPGRIIFRQLEDGVSNTYTYILGCPETFEAIIIDSVLEKAGRDLQIVADLGLRLVASINTHVHADHVTGDAALKKAVPGLRSGVAAVAGAVADLQLAEGDTVPFGRRHVRVLATPGHTDGCLSFLLDDSAMVFTGDALLIRGCGRTDFQQGDARRLYESIHGRIFTLPPATLVYPAHDYQGRLHSTVAEEAALNPRLTKPRDEFVALMGSLGLPRPKQIDVAVPANMRGGVVEAPPTA